MNQVNKFKNIAEQHCYGNRHLEEEFETGLA